MPVLADHGLEMGHRLRNGLPMTDWSSRAGLPDEDAQRLERRIIKLRYCRRWGPHRISYHLGVPRSTVGRVLARYRMPLLAHIDQSTGLPVRKPKPHRYEAAAPGELVHVDIKKLGRIPDGGGWRIFGRGPARTARRHALASVLARAEARRFAGLRLLHHAVDDHSRLAYSEQLRRRKETAAAFWIRARSFFADAGIGVRAVMTDNGACYRSHDFANALGDRSNTAAPGPTAPRPTAKSNASTAPSPPSGPTPRSTSQTKPAQRPTPTGSTSTITTDPTPASEASSPPTAFTTSELRTARRDPSDPRQVRLLRVAAGASGAARPQPPGRPPPSGTADAAARHRAARCKIKSRPRAAPPTRRPEITDLVHRDFHADIPDALWFTDVTQIRTGEGWLWAVVILDAFSREVVCWATAAQETPKTALTALREAMRTRRPPAAASSTPTAATSSPPTTGSTWPPATACKSRWANARAATTTPSWSPGSPRSRTKRSTPRGTRSPEPKPAHRLFQYIWDYNTQRLHSSLGYVAPRIYATESSTCP